MRRNAHTSTRIVGALAAGAIALGLSLAPQAALAAEASPMYRLYNHYDGDHMYTLNAGERDSLVSLGWDDEGIAWRAPETGTSVWRLYNPYSGEHLFTTDWAEYSRLQAIGWRGEGEGFKSGGETPIYRLYNKWLTAGTHLYTTNKAEYDSLGRIGWSQEDVAFYGASAGTSDSSKSDSGKSDSGKQTSITINGKVIVIDNHDLLQQLIKDLGIKIDLPDFQHKTIAVLELDRDQELTITLPNGQTTRTRSVKYVLLPGSLAKEENNGRSVTINLGDSSLTWSTARDLGIDIELPGLSDLKIPIITGDVTIE